MSPSSDALQARAEILKLAQILGCDPERLAYLEHVDVIDLRLVRERTTAVLWDANGTALRRLAAASRLLPVAVSATIAERAFGPLISARMASVLEPKRAADIATRLPTSFLADVAVELDPRRASALISLIPPSQIAAITAQLTARCEYVAMGRFVGHLSDEALSAALAVMDDGTMLKVGFVFDEKRRLERLMKLLAPARIDGLIAAAARENLWLEALDLLGNLNARGRVKIVAGAQELDDEAVAALVATVVEHDLWDQARVLAERVPALERELARRAG